jgi:hypothetical protein
MPPESSDIVVFSVRGRDSRCSECNEEIGHRGLLRKEGDRGLCMDCAELGDLVFLPSGNTALTRRATKYSPMRAVVVLWSTARKRYERQGILVAEEAIERAESECLEDEEIRERKRERNAEHREVLDKKYVASFATKIRERYPSAPAGEEDAIARHACRKYSGRVGRSAAAKEFDPEDRPGGQCLDPPPPHELRRAADERPGSLRRPIGRPRPGRRPARGLAHEMKSTKAPRAGGRARARAMKASMLNVECSMFNVQCFDPYLEH